MNKCSSAQIFKLRFPLVRREVTMKKNKDVVEIANAGSAVTAAKPDFSLIEEFFKVGFRLLRMPEP